MVASLQSLGAEVSRAASSQSSSRKSTFPSHAKTYLHFLFDINLTRKDIILFTQFWSNIFFSNNHLLYGRTFCFFEPLRPVCIDAAGEEPLSEIHPTTDAVRRHRTQSHTEAPAHFPKMEMLFGERKPDRSYSKLGLRISGRLPAQHAWGPVFTPQPQSSQAYKAPQTSAKLCRFSRHLRRGGGGEPSPHTLPIEKITILRTDAITRLGSRNTGPLEFSWLGTCSTWASVS